MAPGSPDTPSTVLTPPTPTDGAAHFSATNSSQSTNGPGAQAPAGRGRSNSLSNAPSKLLGMTSTDGLPTPPSDPPNSATGGGFFSTMFSAAHNAASGLASNLPINLANVPGNRERATTVDLADITGKRTSGDQAGSTVSLAEGPKREPAVKTLGQGELNLATLGIVPDPHTTPMDGTQAPPVRSRDDGALGSSNRNLPLQFVPATYNGLEIVGESPTLRRTNTPHADDIRSYSRAASSVGDVTPDRHSLIESIDEEDEYDGDGRKRTSSVKSGTATNFPKRNRGSSAASNNPMPTSTQPGMRAGFAVANKKRNKEFHNLFKSVPEDDHLIEDYGCALQKEILLQGRMYVTDGHICFYSNILGWVTNLVIAFDEVMSIEKKSTALLFPNAIVIQTLHARHTFASFISRDATYELMVGLWNVGNPEVQTTPNEAHLDGASPMGESGDGDGEDDDEYEDEDSDDGDSFADAGEPVTERTAPPAGAASKNPSRKPSAQPLNNVSAAGGASADNGGSSAGAAGAADAGPDFPGPKTHGATSCGDDDKHYDKQLCDEVLQAPLGRVYSVLFGPASYPFISQLLSEEEKVLDLQIPNNGEWSEVDGKKQRTLNYVKPLPGGIGPSKTKCIVTEVIDHNDLESHVSVGVTTQTPDVPSGGVFSVKTRYCLMWAEGNATRLIATCTVEWTGKSWIKGPIEKGASDGQIAYNKVLLNALRRELAPKGKSGGGAGAAGGKGRKGKKGKKAANSNTESKASTPAAAAVDDSWGILEPLKPIFSPIVDIFKPLLPANFGTILITVLITWFVSGFLRPQQSAVGTIKEPPRHRWESMWVHEEEGLWEWLEDRAGLEAVPSLRSQRAAKANLNLQKKTSQQIKDRQVEEAIEVMKERLGSLERIYGEGRKLKVEEEIYVQEAPKESAAVMPDVEVEETQKDTQKEQVVAEKEL
ncbi:hypothetical protein BZA77DRAFT_243194 [Pyronema omphalodes]|nr:hypothetical protein BZA77DRAFT_243194 [Pyronema omphalodes]